MVVMRVRMGNHVVLTTATMCTCSHTHTHKHDWPAGAWDYLGAQIQGRHNINNLKESLERGSARRSSLKGRERAIINQTNTGTVSEVTLGKLLRGGMELLRAQRYHLELLTWTEIHPDMTSWSLGKINAPVLDCMQPQVLDTGPLPTYTVWFSAP